MNKPAAYFVFQSEFPGIPNRLSAHFVFQLMFSRRIASGGELIQLLAHACERTLAGTALSGSGCKEKDRMGILAAFYRRAPDCDCLDNYEWNQVNAAEKLVKLEMDTSIFIVLRSTRLFCAVFMSFCSPEQALLRTFRCKTHI